LPRTAPRRPPPTPHRSAKCVAAYICSPAVACRVWRRRWRRRRRYRQTLSGHQVAKQRCGLLIGRAAAPAARTGAPTPPTPPLCDVEWGPALFVAAIQFGALLRDVLDHAVRAPARSVVEHRLTGRVERVDIHSMLDEKLNGLEHLRLGCGSCRRDHCGGRA